MSELVLVETADRIRTITFNRPEKKNALTQAMYTAAAEALETGDADPQVRAFIITGTEGVFTAGNDIVDFMQRPPSFGKDEVPPVRRIMEALLNVKKPVVASVDGLAIGIGVTMLMHCDIVYCSNRASFKTPFVDLALAPEYGSSQTFTRAFGHPVAADLLMLGSTWDSHRALAAGLVTHTYSVDELPEAARKAAASLAAKPPAALAEAKALMRLAPEAITDRIQREGQLFSQLLQSPEFAEAAAAFMERRAPDFDKVS